MARTATTVILIAMAGMVGAAGTGRSSAGVKAGVLLSFAESDDKSSIYNIPSEKLGPKAGLFYRLALSGVISLQPELQFALKGTRYYSASVRHTRSVHFYYLEIPIMLNAMAVPGMLEFFAGPYGALLLGCSPSAKSDWTWEGNELKRFDLGACLGARFWRRHFSLELQFARGLIDVLPSYQRSHHNMTIALQFGYRLFK
jgi:hypothetical protein